MFEYYGLERPGSASQHGEKSIKIARKPFRWDGRARFDLIGSPLESKALARVDNVVLGSIFTHVDFGELRRILEKFQPIVARGGKVVFSIFIADTARLEGQGAYGFEDCYQRAWFTTEQLQRLCDQKQLGRGRKGVVCRPRCEPAPHLRADPQCGRSALDVDPPRSRNGHWALGQFRRAGC